jgi:hypothetical protein
MPRYFYPLFIFLLSQLYNLSSTAGYAQDSVIKLTLSGEESNEADIKRLEIVERYGAGLPELRHYDKAFDEEHWRQITAHPDFRYREPQVKQPTSINPGIFLKILEVVLAFFSGAAGKVILTILMGAMVFGLVYRIISGKGITLFAAKSKPLQNKDADDSNRTDAAGPLSDEGPIQEAEAAGNYRLAVRESYRYLLHLLQKAEKIQYQQGYTNTEYLKQLKGTDILPLFAQLTLRYEYAWYGGLDTSETVYQQFRRQFSKIKQMLPAQ